MYGNILYECPLQKGLSIALTQQTEEQLASRKGWLDLLNTLFSMCTPSNILFSKLFNFSPN